MRETTPEVEAIGQLNITGNVIPGSWFKTVVGDTGKPNLNAIMVLSDVVYWYRPTEMRDERTGATVGFQRKFKGDLLQRSYKQLSDQFGISKQSAMRAVVLLEKLGAITRVFRTIETDDTVLNNVLFIKPNVERIFELTYPDTPLPSKMMTGSPQKRGDIYIDYVTETTPSTCNNQTTPDRDGHEGGTNERARARKISADTQGQGTAELDYLIDAAHRDFREAYPDVPLRYQNESFLEREREIVAEAAEAAGDGVGRWREDVLRALRNPDFRKWLMDNRRGDWCPTLGNVLASGDWRRFSTEGRWL